MHILNFKLMLILIQSEFQVIEREKHKQDFNVESP